MGNLGGGLGAELSWTEARARFDADPVVVIPIGAASKAHGAHLPLKTDAAFVLMALAFYLPMFQLLRGIK